MYWSISQIIFQSIVWRAAVHCLAPLSTRSIQSENSFINQHFRFIFHFGILESDSYRAAVSFVVSFSVNNFHCCQIWVDNWIAMPLKPIQLLVWSWSLFWSLGQKCLMQAFSFLSNYDLMLPKVVFLEYRRDCVMMKRKLLIDNCQFNKGTQCLGSFCLWQCSNFTLCGFR